SERRSGTHNHREQFCEGWSSSMLPQLNPVVMGPCFRRDDSTRGVRADQRLDATPPHFPHDGTDFRPALLAHATPSIVLPEPIDRQRRRGGSETMAPAEALQHGLASIDVSDPLLYQNDSW